MRRQREDGVTLIELLIAISITTIIMGPIASAIFVGLHTTGATQNRVQESAGANLLSSYFTPDVQNAVSVATNATEVAGVCPAPLMTVPLLLTTQTGASSISYYQGTGPSDSRVLYRRVCNGGSAGPPTAIARLLAGTSPLGFTCSPGCDASWRSVTASVAQQNLPFDATPYVATVTAARRVS